MVGPAVAVLVIPSFQWIDTQRVGNRIFLELGTSRPPGTASDGWFSRDMLRNCLPEDITASQYSCGWSRIAPLMDSWIETYLASQEDVSGLTQQDSVRFAFNLAFTASSKDPKIEEFLNVALWVRNGQVLHNLTLDLAAMQYTFLDLHETELAEIRANSTLTEDSFSSYTEYNDALELVIQRNSPVLGTIGNMWSTSENATF